MTRLGRSTLLLNSKAPEQMTAECWRWCPRWNRLASSASCFGSCSVKTLASRHGALHAPYLPRLVQFQVRYKHRTDALHAPYLPRFAQLQVRYKHTTDALHAPYLPQLSELHADHNVHSTSPKMSQRSELHSTSPKSKSSSRTLSLSGWPSPSV